MRLANLHTIYIQNTAPQSLINIVDLHLCSLTLIVSKVVSVESDITEKIKVFISTKALKHLYDKKPAEEYDFILNNLHVITKYPDKVYENKGEKRGNYVLIKRIREEEWFCSIEVVEGKCNVVTCFRMRKDSYLNNYNLVWSWKDDIPSS